MSSSHSRQVNRIKGAGRLPLSRTVQFTFDGKIYKGLEGDTLASALIANDVHLMGRSFKYHRPRGVLAAGSEEPNALISVSQSASRHTPNVRATVQEIHEGMIANSQNRWPSLQHDVGAINDIAAPFFSAGFYYKTFMWPRSAWDKLYEPVIRRAAGLGSSPTEPDADHYASRHLHCDVLVCGGGLAGLIAAKTAADAGASVVLADERAQFGGVLLFDAHTTVDGQNGYDWAQRLIAALAKMDNVRLLSRTTVFGYYAQNHLGLMERVTDHLADKGDKSRERLWEVRAGRVIIAAGAIERHMVFANNDRPGILLASAARTFLNHYGVAVGRKVGVTTAHDSAYEAAFDLADAGVKIAAIADVRDAISDALVDGCKARGIALYLGHGVVAAGGKLRVTSMEIAPETGGKSTTIAVDAILMSGGWTPSVHLYSQSRGKVRFDEDRNCFVPGTPVQDQISIGACNGTDDPAELVQEALRAGAEAAAAAGFGSSEPAGEIAVDFPLRWTGGMLGTTAGADASKPVKAFVDYQNDVTAKDIRQAVREGMHSIEHVKRFTTNGMATDQGKLSNMHGLAIAAEALGKPIPQVGLTTFRQPFTPVTFGGIIGHARGKLFDPTRRTALHASLEQAGAVFEDVGQWKRAWYFPKSSETMHEAVNRECTTVRQVAGLFDASTLGKIEVVGPDAAAFLNLLYTNPFLKLEVGRLRYGIMCREDGFIYDDGVVGRLAEDRFHVTTTTGGAARVLHHMEDYLQTEFPQMKVWLTSVSEQWSVIAVQGPKAEEIIAPFVDGMDISQDSMPMMSVREGTFQGVPLRLFRMSFAGEDGFEVNVPSEYGKAAWDALMERGAQLGACAYGTETMHVLRAEKGYIIVGQDTDGTVTPDDAGLGWAVGKKKEDFVGIRGLKRPDLQRDNRRQLVGLTCVDGKTVLTEGAQIVADPKQSVPMKIVGWVTSSYWSENCGHPIAMALIEGGRALTGQTLYVSGEEGGFVEVTVRDTEFWKGAE